MKSSHGGDYPPNWDEIAEYVKALAGYRCIRCGSPSVPGKILTVHHLDMDPSHNIWWNLAALCQVCHLSVQSRFTFDQIPIFKHFEWIQPYIAGYQAHALGLPEDRSWVMAHLQELLKRSYGEIEADSGLVVRIVQYIESGE